jgi:hypothetical protein
MGGGSRSWAGTALEKPMVCGAPQTKLAGHAKSDRSLHSSLHEITEVQQTTARLLGSCLSPKPSTHPVWIYAMDSRQVGSTAVRINTSVVFASPKALRLSKSPSINQPTRQALSLSCTSPGCEQSYLPTMLGLNKPVDEPGAAWPGITVGLFASFAGILYG